MVRSVLLSVGSFALFVALVTSCGPALEKGGPVKPDPIETYHSYTVYVSLDNGSLLTCNAVDLPINATEGLGVITGITTQLVNCH